MSDDAEDDAWNAYLDAKSAMEDAYARYSRISKGKPADFTPAAPAPKAPKPAPTSMMGAAIARRP
jgi:outer membrane protein TolC